MELVARDIIPRDDVFQKNWILITQGNEVSRSFHSFLWFLLVCGLVQNKSGADFPLTQIIAEDVRRVLANAQLLRSQS